MAYDKVVNGTANADDINANDFSSLYKLIALYGRGGNNTLTGVNLMDGGAGDGVIDDGARDSIIDAGDGNDIIIDSYSKRLIVE